MPGTVYSVKVAAFTKGGGGPFSNYVYVNIPGAGNVCDCVHVFFHAIVYIIDLRTSIMVLVPSM